MAAHKKRFTTLSSRERKVLRMRLHGRKLSTIGEELSLTRERARQILKNVEEKIDRTERYKAKELPSRKNQTFAIIKAKTPEVVIFEVAKQFGFSTEDLLGRSRRAEVVKARYFAFYALRNLRLSYPQIGKMMHRDTAVAIHGVKKIKRLIAEA